MWQELRASWIKETLLLARDAHGLLLLFVMPAAFILIMSLAMDEDFKSRAGKKISVIAIDRDRSDASRAFIERIAESGPFEFQAVQDAQAPEQHLRAHRKLFALTIERGYSEHLAEPPSADDPVRVKLTVAADANRQTETIFVAVIREALGRERLEHLLDNLQQGGLLAGIQIDSDSVARGFEVHHDYAEGLLAPTAVQQSVPAWLVFAMFFVAIPVSTTLIQERQLGTLRRLRSTPMHTRVLLFGKLAPYFVVNQVQTVVMLLVGMYLVPLVGGSALELRGSLLGLAIVAASVSVAALGFALLIAATSRTTEQATIIGGAGSILLAALGGIMVPKFVMPLAMQEWTNLSPMAWGLEGFLDILLREKSAADVWPQATALIAFGLIALVLAGVFHVRRIEE
jgi:ABC-2 type transport system permease protein